MTPRAIESFPPNRGRGRKEEPVTRSVVRSVRRAAMVAGALLAGALLVTSGATADKTWNPINVPERFRAPAGEPYQMQAEGILFKVGLFHGSMYDEADWHAFIQISREDERALRDAWWPIGSPSANTNIPELYGEIMVTDGNDDGNFDDEFLAADFTPVLLLRKEGASNLGRELALHAIDDQGDFHDHSKHSDLARAGARAYLQGVAVQDLEKGGTRIELHPLESVAFALDQEGLPLNARVGAREWPEGYVRWRVSYLANSSRHPIRGDIPELARPRRITWHLGPPTVPAGCALQFEVQDVRLTSSKDGGSFAGRGWQSVAPPRWIDGSGGERRLEVSVLMKAGDAFGGIRVTDYVIRSASHDSRCLGRSQVPLLP